MVNTVDFTQPDLSRQVQISGTTITPAARLETASKRSILCSVCPFGQFPTGACAKDSYIRDTNGKPEINLAQLEYVAREFVPEGTPLPLNNPSLMIALLALCTLGIRQQRSIVNDEVASSYRDYIK
jgi:hypothetical protein